MNKHIKTLIALAAASLALAAFTTAQPAATEPAKGQSEVSKPVITEWKEYWGTPGETNVTYHDQYRITQTSGGTVKVEILNRNQKTSNERLEGNVFTFTQHTDAYVVQYSLTLQQDGKWMVGTATTPKKVVNVKWERQSKSKLEQRQYK